MTSQNQESAPSQDPQRNARYRAIFNRCDGNNDGYISVGELADFINSNTADARTIPRHVAEKIHRMADENEGKMLDFREFVNLLEHRQNILAHYITKYVDFLVPRHKPALVQRLNKYTCPSACFMILVSVLQVSFFMADEIMENDSSTGLGVTATIFIYNPKKRHEFWRLLTCMFVHIGYEHLIMNVFLQLLLGVPLEMVYKWWRVMIIYFAGGLAGSLLFSIIVPPIYFSGGASGGVYSLMTAHIACIIMNWSEMSYPYIQILIFTIIVLSDLGWDIYNIYFQGEGRDVGVEDHLGGAITGLLVGIYTLRGKQAGRVEKYIWWKLLIIYVLFVGTATVLNLVYL